MMRSEDDDILVRGQSRHLRVRIVTSNETPAAKQYRLAVAMVRAFIKEYPNEAVKMVRELVPGVVK